MQAKFFPSRTVALYMARLFVVRTIAILAALVITLQALDLLGESGKILAVAGNGDAEIWRYVGLRTPQIIGVFLPFSVLLSTIWTLSTLNANSEVIALKASGLSAHQVLAPLILTGLLIAIVSFGFNDRIVSRATATLNRWQKIQYAPLPMERGDRFNVWVRDGNDLINVDSVRGRGKAVILSGITVYDRQDGNLMGIIRAKTGHHVAGGWEIEAATGFDVATGKMRSLGNKIVARSVRPDQFTLTNVDPNGLSFGDLRNAVEDLHDAGRPTKALEGSLWHKISGPLSAVLMPLLGAVAAFGIARSGKLFVRAVIGISLGFAYFVADNFAIAMGDLGAYPPLLAAWAPFILFLLIGELVLVRTEE